MSPLIPISAWYKSLTPEDKMRFAARVRELKVEQSVRPPSEWERQFANVGKDLIQILKKDPEPEALSHPEEWHKWRDVIPAPLKKPPPPKTSRTPQPKPLSPEQADAIARDLYAVRRIRLEEETSWLELGPSEDKITRVMRAFQDFLLVAPADDPAAQRAMAAVIQAAEWILLMSGATLEIFPCEENMNTALIKLQKLMSLESTENRSIPRQAWQRIRTFAGTERRRATGKFRKEPTLSNFTQMNRWIINTYMLGAGPFNPGSTEGIPRRKNPGSYTVRANDSLSSISERYYGSSGYWDVIYFANLDKLGSALERALLPSPGLVLKIP